MSDDIIKKAADDIANAFSDRLRVKHDAAEEKARNEESTQRRKAERENRINAIAQDAEKIFNQFRDTMQTNRDLTVRVLHGGDAIYLQKNKRLASITATRIAYLLIKPATKPDFGRPVAANLMFVSVGIARGFENDNSDEFLFIYSTSEKTGSPANIKLQIDPASDPRITVEQLTRTITEAVTEASK